MHVADPRDLTFRDALSWRLSRLTPEEQRLILTAALAWLRAILPLLPAHDRRLLTNHLASVMERAGCRGEAALLRLMARAPDQR